MEIILSYDSAPVATLGAMVVEFSERVSSRSFPFFSRWDFWKFEHKVGQISFTLILIITLSFMLFYWLNCIYFRLGLGSFT